MATPRRVRRPALFALAGLALAGLLICVGAAATVLIWFDEATMGLMARDVLAGQFPLFFYGQSFMGAVDGYLHAVPFALLGESVATPRVWAVALSLAHVGVGTHVLRAGVERVVVTFPVERVRGVRVAQTGRDALHPWSVAELRLLSP